MESGGAWLAAGRASLPSLYPLLAVRLQPCPALPCPGDGREGEERTLSRIASLAPPAEIDREPRALGFGGKCMYLERKLPEAKNKKTSKQQQQQQQHENGIEDADDGDNNMVS